jgi:hypothetical protein
VSANGFIARSFVWTGTGKLVPSFGFGGAGTTFVIPVVPAAGIGCVKLSNEAVALADIGETMVATATLNDVPVSAIAKLSTIRVAFAELDNEPIATVKLKLEKC